MHLLLLEFGALFSQMLIQLTLTPIQAKIHHCINDDFKAENKVGVWTMLNDNMDYVKGAIKLGKGVREHTKTPLD